MNSLIVWPIWNYFKNPVTAYIDRYHIINPLEKRISLKIISQILYWFRAIWENKPLAIFMRILTIIKQISLIIAYLSKISYFAELCCWVVESQLQATNKRSSVLTHEWKSKKTIERIGQSYRWLIFVTIWIGLDQNGSDLIRMSIVSHDGSRMDQEWIKVWSGWLRMDQNG